ncbi:MAG: hypothetical protein IKB42_03580 [Clostridia bacterium]|nr:hypothetical protein [Clostridia bacterium]
MIRIWAKIIIDGKIVKSHEITVQNYDYHIFDEYVREIAYGLDIPTPVVLDKHIIDFTVYKSTRFFKEDFVESVDFEKLVLENVG